MLRGLSRFTVSRHLIHHWAAITSIAAKSGQTETSAVAL